MSLENTYAVIMAGGGGTRLWPLSRSQRPKQSLQLFRQRTLFQLAVDRLTPVLEPERILVVTVPAYAELLRGQADSLAADNFISEPFPRGTASAIGLVAIMLHQRDPGAVMACLTADHIIRNEQRFRELLGAAEALALEGELVTLGVTPSYPSSGYGYIHIGGHLKTVEGFEAHRVLRFEEKPDRELAERYLESGEYAWNSGMFVWRVTRILEEIERLMPELHAGLAEIAEALGTDQQGQVVQRVWDQLKAETIDYGIMERAERVSVIRADDLDWLDIGGWDRLPDLADTDKSGNLVVAGKALLLDSAGSVVYQAGSDRLIAILGIEDLIVVDTDDVLLVCRRDQAEGVRRLVAKLSEMGWDEYS